MPPSAGSSTVLFDAVKGHGRQKERLLAALSSGRLPHALLFTGPGGVGKRRVAVALAQALFCSAPAGQQPCGACSGCRKTAEDLHPDLVRIGVDPETKSRAILLPQVLLLNDALSRTPGESGRRLVIIDDADRMSGDAQSAFLKTLEEPMGQTFFVLIASEPGRLMATIRSRCQTVRFGSLGLTDTEDILMEEDGISPREASDYARLSQGSVEEALLLRDGGYREVVDAALRLVSLALERRTVEWPAIGTNRDELLLLADALIRVHRDALLLLATPDAAKRLFLADRAEEIGRLAASSDAERIQETLEALCSARDRLLSYVNPRLVAAQILFDLGIKLL